MKKILVTILAVLFCIGLMACGGTEEVPSFTQGNNAGYVEEAEPTTEPTVEPTATPTPVVTKKYGISSSGKTDGFHYELDTDYMYYRWYWGQKSSTLYRMDIHTGEVEVALDNLGNFGSFIIANGNVYYYDSDSECWFSASLATGEKKLIPVGEHDGAICIYKNMLFYTRSVDVSASKSEKQLIQIKNFESENPEEIILASTRDDYFSIEKINEDGSFLVETSYTEFQRGTPQFGTTRRIYDYQVYSGEGNLLHYEPTFRGYKTFMRGNYELGVGWIGTNIDEANMYGFIDAYGNTTYDENITEIYTKASARYIKDRIIFYSDANGIHAYDMSNGKQADIIEDAADRIVVVAGDYVYYIYSKLSDSRVYRVKTDGTGWEEVGTVGYGNK